ncbi:hypothetical protein TWF694_003138 [Orbilia ellipsospora]|uniref:Uncharacterized protein n=1 Tax=Orbilia ellipsospora TaxID=2528407 RepID=A0AAV9X0M1_9PEZI
MVSLKAFYLGSAFIVKAYATLNPTACYADNCLRALRGLASKSYTEVSSDCAHYVYTTETPLAVTVFATATVSCSTTLTTEVPYTSTKTVDGGVSVETVYGIITQTGPPTTIIATVPDTVSGTPQPQPQTLKKRDSTSPVPIYASACTSGARYASACSCFGVPASIATANPSTVTWTITTSVTATFYTTNPVVDATITVTLPPVNQTVSVVSTTTEVATAIFTAFSVLEVAGPNLDGRLWFAQESPAWQFYFADTAEAFVRDNNGRIYLGQLGARWYGYCVYAGGSAVFDPGEGNDAVAVSFYSNGRSSTNGVTFDGTELYCDINTNYILNCSCTTPEGHWTNLMYGPYSYIQLSKPDYQYRASWNEGPITLQAVTPREQDYCGPDTATNPVCVEYWDPNAPFTYKNKKRMAKDKRRV